MGCGHMFVIAGIFDRLFKRKEKPIEEEYYGPEFPSQGGYDTGMMAENVTPEYYNEPTELDIKPSVNYNFDGPLYSLKLFNKNIDVIGDITVHLDTNKKAIATLDETKRVFEMLEPEKSTVMKFKIKPKYKSGKTTVYGKVEYFDFKSKERKIVRLPRAIIDFEFNKLTPKRTDEDKWRQTIGSLKAFEIETDVLDLKPSELFNIFKSVLSDLGLFMLPPIENVNLYRGIAKFLGNDANKKIYAVEVQVIGDRAKSKVLFRIWSSEGKDAMALAFKTLDSIEDIIKIKKFIVET